MKFILECDGVLLDERLRHVYAYNAACRELGLPRTDPALFWRGIRRGAPDGELVRGARPAPLAEFRQRFDAHLEDEEAFAGVEAVPDCPAALSRLARHGRCALVSFGANRAARQRVLSATGLAYTFLEMEAMSEQRSVRVTQLRKLAEGDRRTILGAASVRMVTAGEQAGLFLAGVASGSCVAARLTRAGARCVFADLAGLADCIDGGAQELVRAGLLPAAQVQ